MEFEHKRFGKCVVSDITQKQLEDFYRALKGSEHEPMPVWRGVSVRHAAKLGILVEPKLEFDQVDGMKQNLIIRLAERIAKGVTEETEIDT